MRKNQRLFAIVFLAVFLQPGSCGELLDLLVDFPRASESSDPAAQEAAASPETIKKNKELGEKVAKLSNDAINQHIAGDASATGPISTITREIREAYPESSASSRTNFFISITFPRYLLNTLIWMKLILHHL